MLYKDVAIGVSCGLGLDAGVCGGTDEGGGGGEGRGTAVLASSCCYLEHNVLELPLKRSTTSHKHASFPWIQSNLNSLVYQLMSYSLLYQLLRPNPLSCSGFSLVNCMTLPRYLSRVTASFFFTSLPFLWLHLLVSISFHLCLPSFAPLGAFVG